MLDYRFYKLDRAGRAIGQPRIVRCEDDDAALIEAQKDVDGHAIEVWRDSKRVGLLPGDD